MSQWVKVEFYGRVPDGQKVTDINYLEVGERLARAFGFTHIDGLAAFDTPDRLDISTTEHMKQP